MTRTELAELLQEMDLPGDSEEAAHRERMLMLLEEPRCFWRDCFPGHFTGSALVVSHDGSRVLLHHHKFLNRWMQFGGHCDGDEDVLRAAVRETTEETGIDGLITTAKRPFDIDIHPIPENPKKGEPAHEHFDIRWVLIAPENAQFHVTDESNELRWFTREETQALDLDASMVRLLDKWKALLKRRLHKHEQ